MRFQPVGIFLTLLLLAGSWNSVQAAPDGRAIYRAQCAGCHQSEGKGGIGLPLTPEILAHVSDDFIRDTIRYGRPGRIMPSFVHLSDAQVNAVVNFIRSRAGVPEMAFSDKQVKGDAGKGAQLYTQHCASCHGEDGSGKGLGTGVTLSRERSFLVMPAAIGNPGFLAAAPDEMIKHTITVGRSKGGMPAFGKQLSEAEINDIVAHVRSFERPDKVSSSMGLTEIIPPSHVVESPVGFKETVKRIKQTLKGYNFRYFPDRYLEEGLTTGMVEHREELAIRFCNFNELYKLLRVEPRLGAVLPCRMTVVKRADGKVLIIAGNMRFIAGRFNNNQLTDWAAEMDRMIQDILDEVTI